MHADTTGAQVPGIQLGTSGPIATIALNRPDKHNALRSVEWVLETALTSIAREPALRLAVIRGAGDRAFSTGSDIADIAGRSPYDNYGAALRLQRVFHLLVGLRKPSIAMIRGYAIGGGLELALPCTFRVAAMDAALGIPEIRLATLAGAGGTQRVLQLLGHALAMRMLLLGEMLTADDAARGGLVDSVVPAAELGSAVGTITDRLLQQDSSAVAMILDCHRLSRESSMKGNMIGEAALFGLTTSTNAFKQAAEDFQSRREDATNSEQS
jgi:enoyl-CoA hydratase